MTIAYIHVTTKTPTHPPPHTSGLLVSRPTCTELGSCHPVLTSKKLNRLKSSFYFHQKREDMGQTTTPKIRRAESYNLPEPRLINRNHHRNQCWEMNTWTVIDKLLEAQCGQFWELKTSEGHSLRESHKTTVRFISKSLMKFPQ